MLVRGPVRPLQRVGEHLVEASEWEFAAYVPASALEGGNTELIVEELAALMPEGPEYFPPGTTTDQPEEFRRRIRDYRAACGDGGG